MIRGKNRVCGLEEICLASDERKENWAFYFSEILYHAAAWFGHATAC